MNSIPYNRRMSGDREELEDVQMLLNCYGPIAITLHMEMKTSGILGEYESVHFLKKLVHFYAKNLMEMEKNRFALLNIRRLVSLFPSFSQLRKILRPHTYRGREMIFFKLLLDILTNYYKATEIPLFKTLQGKVIPLALSFYSSQSTSTLHDIVEELMVVTESTSTLVVKY
eukprot:TRINITY_DN990_c0_g1_i5.p1 TRINITY_DN990_c0_g1~~TRINITY_DN990_c0_g1_i5.p1  ORF type:complete len:171 (-),score=15.54 TRINITY_DN990_c0_g1_i5:114-626(-)